MNARCFDFFIPWSNFKIGAMPQVGEDESARDANTNAEPKVKGNLFLRKTSQEKWAIENYSSSRM